MKTTIKFFLLVHRYLGFALSLLFVVWFLSGFAMMYVRYPTMRQHEKLQNLAPVDLQLCKLNLNEALVIAGVKDTMRTVRLGMMLGRPVYRLTTTRGDYKAVFADNGELFSGTDSVLADKLASTFGKPCRVRKTAVLTQIDQWMAGARSQGYTTPVYQMQMDDDEDTYMYVSVQTGEVVQRVNARQRFLAWLGPIPHWIYLTVLLRNRSLWNDIIIWISSLGVIMCIAGIVMGLVRYKRKDKSSLAFSPYKKRWFRWHHYTGFIFGIVVFTWVFSGLLSMTPWDWAPMTRLDIEETAQWTGGPMKAALFSLSPSKVIQRLNNEISVKEIHLIQLNGKPYYLAYEDDDHTRLMPADVDSGTPFEKFDYRPFIKMVQALNPGIGIKESKVLSEYDDYYYSKYNEKRLPVLRVKMSTLQETWYYVDLKTGQVVLKHEKLSRLERWLYHGLHSLDFKWLVYRRPLWDFVVGVLMIGGLSVSVTGLVLTWKWIKRKANLKPAPKKRLKL
ncbi:PepSY domain-containing protein [Chitinophaga ginsengisoli]|uniref:PepSY-associated transmembrane protein n=1 Tax=Chitinophaga ginsengisoli TaxID=363837 RepID=A0A2P8FXI4_9BACT|nr:PepSY domain-containing protein [Chitinophaga ginsengisoli]PSL26428.1 PepSY-associated transmembrane protein [Chitinophaga ginsengisoli]